MKKVSIIVPVYNVEKYLKECLESILEQNFTDYEIICIDDASTDHSENILATYKKRYNNLSVIRHTENMGLSAARNTGLKYAVGEYVWFVDSDDMIAPSTLKKIYYIAKENSVDIVYFDMLRINEEDYKKNLFIKTLSEECNAICTGKDFFCQLVENHKIGLEVCRQFIRREFLIKQNIVFYEGILHEDEIFSFLCMMNAEKVVGVNGKYYIYRQRKGSIMHNKSYRRSESIFVVLIQIMAYWVSHVFTERENQAIAQYFRELYHAYQFYSCFTDKNKELEVGGVPERTLFSLIYVEKDTEYLSLSIQQIEKIKKENQIVVFGAGKAAMDIVNILKRRNMEIDAIAVSDVDSNPRKFCGIRVDLMDNIAREMKDAIVIIGVTKKYRKEILDDLKKLGFKNVIIPEDKGIKK